MRRKICVPLFLGVATVCFAQDGGTLLSLKDAEAMAIKNHPQVLASQASSASANQVTREARSTYYPTLNGEVTGAQANMDARLGAGVLNDPRLFTHFGSGLTLSQLITDSGRTHNLVANAKLQFQASQENVRATQFEVLLNVDQAYYEVQLAEQLVTVSEQTVKARQTVVDQINELFKNKLKSQVDVSFAQLNLTDAKLMLLRAQDRLNAAYASLGAALGAPQAVRYRLTEQPAIQRLSGTEEGFIDQAIKSRPEIASLRLQTEADQKMVYAERDLKRPTVSLSAVGGALPFIKPGNANPDIPTGYEAAAVNVNIPIFNGHLFSAREQAAAYQTEAAKQRLRDLQNIVARDVRTAWERAQTSYQAIAATQELLNQANMALDLAQGRYQLGLASIVELSQAQLAQTQAQVENVNAKYEYQEAYSALQYTVGGLH